VLGCDERVIALISRARGFTEHGGLGEIAYGQVAVVEDGSILRLERDEPDDRDAMLTRFGELRDEHGSAPAPDRKRVRPRRTSDRVSGGMV
jgi:DUF1009 family protein